MLKPAGTKGDLEHFQSSEQHVNGCILLVRYDFLLVFLTLGLSGTTGITIISKKTNKNRNADMYNISIS